MSCFTPLGLANANRPSSRPNNRPLEIKRLRVVIAAVLEVNSIRLTCVKLTCEMLPSLSAISSFWLNRLRT